MKKSIIILVLNLLFCVIILSSCVSSHTHEFGEWTVVKNPTCTEDGMQERLCSCGEKQTQAIPASGHTIELIAEVKATCTTDGATSGTYCSKCGEQINKPQVVPASHSYDSGKEVKHSTCTEEGVKQYTCLVCGTTKDEPIAKASHSFDSGKITKEATCTQSGTKTFTCGVCGTTKTDTIAALGHNPNSNYICQRCGEKCPVTLNMTSAEKANASKVHYISQRQIYHDDDKKEFRLQFSLLDASEKELDTAAVVEIKIVNDKSETVYTAIKIIRASDFSTWTRTLTGAKNYLATIYIKDSDITPGKSSKGTVYFTVYNSGYFSFDETALSTYDDLPVKAANVSVPSLPKTITEYGYSGTKYSSCKVTDITYKVSSGDLYIYFTVEKTYDREGSGHSSACEVGWKVYDADNYVVASGTFYSDAIRVGEKVKGGRSCAWDCIEPGGSYRIEILDVK